MPKIQTKSFSKLNVRMCDDYAYIKSQPYQNIVYWCPDIYGGFDTCKEMVVDYLEVMKTPGIFIFSKKKKGRITPKMLSTINKKISLLERGIKNKTIISTINNHSSLIHIQFGDYFKNSQMRLSYILSFIRGTINIKTNEDKTIFKKQNQKVVNYILKYGTHKEIDIFFEDYRAETNGICDLIDGMSRLFTKNVVKFLTDMYK